MTGQWLPFDAAGTTDLERKAIAFDQANPGVYVRLVELAREARRHGRRRIGIKLLFERMRWDNVTRTKGDRYVLNNSYTAYFARKLERLNPELRGMFVTRKSAHDTEYHQREMRRVS